jgi:hypothetical protein
MAMCFSTTAHFYTGVERREGLLCVGTWGNHDYKLVTFDTSLNDFLWKLTSNEDSNLTS